MKILAISDSHGEYERILDVLEENPGIRTVIFLGDGIGDIQTVKRLYPSTECVFLTVRGNCDFVPAVPSETNVQLEGHRIFFTHGHKYFVKSGLTNLCYAAQSNNVTVVLFGHTHVPYNKRQEGILFVNPGSISGWHGGGTYALLEITPESVSAEIRVLGSTQYPHKA